MRRFVPSFGTGISKLMPLPKYFSEWEMFPILALNFLKSCPAIFNLFVHFPTMTIRERTSFCTMTSIWEAILGCDCHTLNYRRKSDARYVPFSNTSTHFSDESQPRSLFVRNSTVMLICQVAQIPRAKRSCHCAS